MMIRKLQSTAGRTLRPTMSPNIPRMVGVRALLYGLGASPADGANVERAADSVAPMAEAMGQQAAASAGLARVQRRAGMQMRSFYPPFGG
jgi:hypothetical protein